MLRVVHVLRPNKPAVPRAPAQGSNDHSTIGGGSSSQPGSPGPPLVVQSMSSSSGAKSSRPGSSSMYGKRAVGRAAAAASGMDSITSLDAEEMLGMLLLVSSSAADVLGAAETALLLIARVRGLRMCVWMPLQVNARVASEVLEDPTTVAGGRPLQ